MMSFIDVGLCLSTHSCVSQPTGAAGAHSRGFFTSGVLRGAAEAATRATLVAATAGVAAVATAGVAGCVVAVLLVEGR